MRISDKALAQIKEQIRFKDLAAHALGVAMVSMELEKLRLTDPASEMSRSERYMRLGAVQSEFDGYRATHMGVVLKANARQREIGEAALEELGLASESRVFTIDERNGDVLELINDTYVAVLEAA